MKDCKICKIYSILNRYIHIHVAIYRYLILARYCKLVELNILKVASPCSPQTMLTNTAPPPPSLSLPLSLISHQFLIISNAGMNQEKIQIHTLKAKFSKYKTTEINYINAVHM